MSVKIAFDNPVKQPPPKTYPRLMRGIVGHTTGKIYLFSSKDRAVCVVGDDNDTKNNFGQCTPSFYEDFAGTIANAD